MTLTEVLPVIRQLPTLDKLRLIRILAQEQDGVSGQNARDVLKWLLGGFEPIRDHALSDIGTCLIL